MAVNQLRNPRVLIVDDEKIVANTLALVLTASCFETRAAYTVNDALTIARRDQPELALVDVMLPDMSGAALANAIGQVPPKTRVVLFSGAPEAGDIAADSGLEIIPKPVDPTVIIGKLRAMLSGNSTTWLSHRGLRMHESRLYKGTNVPYAAPPSFVPGMSVPSPS